MRTEPRRAPRDRSTLLSRVAPALALLIALSLAGCDESAPPPPTASNTPPPSPTADTLRILFIGNSLTYVNDLPSMLIAISAAAGDTPPIETSSVTFGGYALEDHLAQGDAAAAIAAGDWDVVALQQGPSSLPASRTNLIEYTRRFATLIRQAGAKPALYGVWPEADRIGVLDACIESYRAAADSVGGISFPAALAWKIGWRMDPSLPLYGPDAFHPSELGTYTAALVIYAVLRERTPVGLPHRFRQNGGLVTLDSLQARTAQLAAAEATGMTVAREHAGSSVPARATARRRRGSPRGPRRRSASRPRGSTAVLS